jgi:hypothetical protein
MKSLNAAAVVAGAMAIAGAATPAFAYNTGDVTPTSLSGAVNTLAKGPFDVMPTHHQSNALDTENKDSVLNTVKGMTGALNQHNPLLGGLPLHN